MDALRPYLDQDALPVAIALDNFSLDHRRTLQLMIDKHKLILPVPIPIMSLRVSLRDQQHIVKIFEDSLVRLLPTRNGTVTRDIAALEVYISNTFAAYPGP